MISCGQQVIPRPLKAVKMLSCHVQLYYDDEKPCTIQVDASNVSVGATLIQEGKVTEYNS